MYDESTLPWIAVDVSEYQSGNVQCGDVMLLYFADGSTMHAMAYDAGYLYNYRTAGWPDMPIVADVPAFLVPFTGTSSVVFMLNYSAVQRRIREFTVGMYGIDANYCIDSVCISK